MFDSVCDTCFLLLYLRLFICYTRDDLLFNVILLGLFVCIQTMCTLLTRCGYWAEAAADMTTAMCRMTTEPFDCVLIDTMLGCAVSVGAMARGRAAANTGTANTGGANTGAANTGTAETRTECGDSCVKAFRALESTIIQSE